MTDYMAQMLNELMGQGRDALPGESKETNFDDPNVCTDFLVGFCTHEIFRNTKNDLGFCKYPIHDENLRRRYETSDEKGKMGFEERFLSRLKRIQEDVQRKIKRHEERLSMTQGESNRSEEVFEKKMSELQERREVLNKKIEALVNEAESEGEKGNVAEAQAAVEKTERLTAERDQLDNDEINLRSEKDRAISLEENVTVGNRKMQVCNVCGCFMLQNDAPQRIDDHVSGKLHIAYQTISDSIKTLNQEIEDRRKKRVDHNKSDRKREEKRVDHKRDRYSDRKRSRSRERERERDRIPGRERKEYKDRSRDRRDHRIHRHSYRDNRH